MDIQQRIKNNVEDFRCIINDMSNWEEEMKRKEASLQQHEDTNDSQDLPPVRTKLRKKETDLNEKTAINSEHSNCVEECPNRAKSLIEKDLGNEFVKQKKWSDAIHHYTIAIDLYNEDPAFFCNRAQCYLQTEQWTKAVADCNRALELDSNYMKAYYRKGLALKELNEIKSARDHFQKALQLESTNQNVKNDLLLLNESLGDQCSSNSFDDFENNLTDRQKREKSLDQKERGNALVKLEKWTDAIYHYTEAIKCYSRDATFYCNRALCFLHVKKFKEAETDCTTALQLETDYVKAYHRRGLALKELNQLKEAYENLKKALELDPKNNRIKKDLSKVEKCLNDSNSLKFTLETKFEDPLLSDKDRAYVKKEKGNVFVQKKDWKSAIECYTEACKLYPEDISFYLNRALCFLKMKEPKKALLDCTLVLERVPNNVKAYYRRALAHETIGNFSKAHDDLLEAFKLNPSDTSIQNKLTKLEEKMGILEPEVTSNEDNISNVTEPILKPVSWKRIKGEKFIKLGGSFVQPAKKLPHQVSKRPLKSIKITDKNEDTLKSAFEEITVAEINVSCGEENRNVNEPFSRSMESHAPRSTKCVDQVQNISVAELPIPRTFMQFMSAWNSLNSSESQYLYLKRIHGEDLPRIFKESLESHIFSDILDILVSEFVKANEPVYHYLFGLSHVKRIKAMLLFATEEDNANIKILLGHIEKLKEVTENESNALRSFYYC